MNLVENEGIEAGSKYVNQALQMAPRNAPLHVLNGFVYEEISRYDPAKNALASVAYQTACNLDPSLWIAAYLKGCCLLRTNNYDEAQATLTNALILQPKSSDTLYALAYASYFCRDLPVALHCIQEVLKLRPQDHVIQKAAALIFSAVGQKENARRSLKAYGNMVGCSSPAYRSLCERVRQWESLLTLASQRMIPEGQTSNLDYKPDPASETIVIDCYIFMVVDETSTLQGNNFMEQLQVTLTSGSNGGLGTIARSLARSTRTGYLPSPVSSHSSKKMDLSMSPGIASYSLNIANSQRSHVDLLARPSISTLVGRTAVFHEGLQYTGGADGANGSAIINVPTGTRVQVTPKYVTEEGEVIMDISLEISAFAGFPDPKKSISSQLLNTSIGQIKSTIKSFFGQTTIVGGHYELKGTQKRSEFPGAGSIPLLQYFTAQKNTTETKRSALYLITPRRGGKNPKKRPLCQASAAHQTLKKSGLMSVGEFPALFYILKTLESAPFYADFRSGDLTPPVNNFDCMPLSSKLEELAGFLYF